MGKRFARCARGWGVGLVALGIVLLVTVAACGDSGGGIPTAVAVATSAHSGETPARSPGPVAEITYSHRLYASEPELYASEPWQERVMLFGSITGVLTYEEAHVLPKGALIRIALRTSDTYGGFSKYQPTPLETTQFPMSFVIHCDPCAVNAWGEYFADVMINGPPVGPPPPKPHFAPAPPHVGAILFLNAIKVIVIDDKVFAKDIEIPVVPQPTLSGTISPGKGENTPDNASGYVGLLDVSEPGAEPVVLSSRFIEATATFPKPFSMTYHPADIDPQGTYVLEAELRRFEWQACRGHYRTKEIYEVITGGNLSHDIQLEIVQVDKWIAGEMARVTGTLSYMNRFEDGDTNSNSEDGDTDSNSEGGDTDPRGIESAEDLPTGTVWQWWTVTQTSPTVTQTLSPPPPNPDNPWHIGIIDLSEDCTLAEVQIDGSMPLPLSFSIPYNRSHIDPNSDYAIRANHLIGSGDCTAGGLRGEAPIALTPDNPQDDIALEVGEWRSIC